MFILSEDPYPAFHHLNVESRVGFLGASLCMHVCMYVCVCVCVCMCVCVCVGEGGVGGIVKVYTYKCLNSVNYILLHEYISSYMPPLWILVLQQGWIHRKEVNACKHIQSVWRTLFLNFICSNNKGIYYNLHLYLCRCLT